MGFCVATGALARRALAKSAIRARARRPRAAVATQNRLRAVALSVALATFSLSAADFIVTSTNAAGEGSLADAIRGANVTPGSRILFGIDGTPPFRIVLADPLPPVLARTQILGNSQPGFVGTPLITLVNELSCAAPCTAPPAIDIRASGSRVEGLAFLLSQGEGIVAAADDVTVWKCTFTRSGVPRPDEQPAIRIAGSRAYLADNHAGFGTCVSIDGSDNLVYGNRFQGCYATSVALRSGQRNGIAAGNVIGPAVVDGSAAISIDVPSSSNHIAENLISGVWGGVDVRGDSNYIGWNNEIRDASAFGIRIDGGKRNRITENLLAANGAIILANNGNHALAPPRLDSVFVSGDQTLVRGTAGRPGSFYVIELFAGDQCGGEKRFVGSAGTSQSNFALVLSAIRPGSSVTAVAIDQSFPSEGFADTSAFSNCVTATGTAAVAAPVLTSLVAEGWVGDNVALNGMNIHENARVFFGNSEAALQRYSTPRFVRVPEGEGTVDVVVRNPDGQEAIARNAFTYRKPSWVYVNRGAKSVSIRPGEAATLSVVASSEATPLSYQWYTGRLLDRSAPIAGETRDSITVTPSKTTDYWVLITNARGKFSFSSATVSLPKRRAVQ